MSGLVEEWLSSLSSNSARVYSGVFEGFIKWVEGGESGLDLEGFEGDTAERLLGLQRVLNNNGESRKAILRASYSYIKDVGGARGWRTGYRRKVLSVVRSFFVYHLDEEGFPRESARKKISVLKSSTRAVQKDLSLEELRDVALKSTPMYRTVLKCMLASGMGEDEVVEWSDQGIDALRDAMEGPAAPGVVEVYLGSRKTNVDKEFYAYIGGGAYRELKNWLKARRRLRERFNDPQLRERREREANGARVFPDSIFVTNTFTPLSKSGFYTYFSRKLFQLGYIERAENGHAGTRYNKNPHQIRSLFRSQWSKSRQNADIGEYFMGHVVDSLDYNQVHEDREYRIKSYVQALPYIDLDDETAFGLVRESSVEKMVKSERDAMQQQIDALTKQFNELRNYLSTVEAQPELVAGFDLQHELDQYELELRARGLEEDEIYTLLEARHEKLKKRGNDG